MDDNELLKKDLIFILCASEKFDLSKDEYVKKLNLLLKRRSDVNTILGKTYRERLKDIEEGKIAEYCFICNKNHAADRVICSSCMEKYSGGKKHIFSEIVSTVETSTAKTSTAKAGTTETSTAKVSTVEKSPVKESVATTPTPQEAPVIDNKEKSIEEVRASVDQIKPIGEEVKTSTVEAKAKPQKQSKVLGFFGKELSRRYRVIIAMLAVLILVAGVAGAKGRNISVSGVPVNNGETYVTSEGLELSYYEAPTGEVGLDEAERILSTLYPKSDGFQVDHERDGKTFQFWFWGPLGRTTDLSELIVEGSNDEALRNMAYSVESVYYFSIKSDSYEGLAIVNSDGRIVAQGNLPGFPDSTNIIRIR